MRRVRYGSIVTLIGRKHPRVLIVAKTRGEGSRMRRAARSKLAGCATLHRKEVIHLHTDYADTLCVAGEIAFDGLSAASRGLSTCFSGGGGLKCKYDLC